MSWRVLSSESPPSPCPELAFQEALMPRCPGRGRKDSVALATAHQEGAHRCEGEAISLS